VKAINIYIKILSLIVFGSLLRTLFQIAYLGASQVHEGFAPNKETSYYMLIALFFFIIMLWCVVIIRKSDLPFRLAQIAIASAIVIPAIFYMAFR
jgi:hypothetical protein